MGAKGTTHMPKALQSPDGWPHTAEQRERRNRRMRERLAERRTDPEYIERERVWRQSESGKASLRAADRRSKRQRRDKLNAIKIAAGCTDCGFAAHPAALQFDHVRGVKAFEIGSRPGMAWDRILTEIEKCDIVCANCHAIRTANRRGATE